MIELIPNPEVNTREHVEAQVNRLDIVLDTEGGFASLDAGEGESWGRFEVTDFDSDGVLELVLIRPGSSALEPFALTAGSQPSRRIHITARGTNSNKALTALGGAHTALEVGTTKNVQVPFNLLPDRRPLRVLSMVPPSGSRNLEAPVEGVTIQLGGEVLAEAIDGNLLLRALSVDEVHLPITEVSYIETGLGLVTNVRFFECPLPPGEFVIEVAAAVCTTTDQCLDQHLNEEGAQPFEGSLHIQGTPFSAECTDIVTLSTACPEVGCPPGTGCNDGGTCVPDAEVGGQTEVCGSTNCPSPLYVCDEGECVDDCTFFGACPEPDQVCDETSRTCR